MKMGEVADMMLDGTLCEGCGVFLNADAPGYPCCCSSCKRERSAVAVKQSASAAHGGLKKLPRVKCGQCGRWISPRGMQAHNHAKHAGSAA
jgi:hypothetical protein